MSAAYDDGAGAGGSNNRARWTGLREGGMVTRRRAITRRTKGVVGTETELNAMRLASRGNMNRGGFHAMSVLLPALDVNARVGWRRGGGEHLPRQSRPGTLHTPTAHVAFPDDSTPQPLHVTLFFFSLAVSQRGRNCRRHALRTPPPERAPRPSAGHLCRRFGAWEYVGLRGTLPEHQLITISPIRRYRSAWRQSAHSNPGHHTRGHRCLSARKQWQCPSTG